MSNLATITNNILADSGIDDINVVVTTGSYANPAWITSLAWTKITGAPANIVTGTGNDNYIAKFTSTGSTIGNSLLQSTSANVFINQEDTSFGIDAQANIRLGFTKKGGFQPFVSYAIDPFTIRSTSGTSIAAGNTFVTRFTIGTDGVAIFGTTLLVGTAANNGSLFQVNGEATFGSTTEKISMTSQSLGFNRRVSNGDIYDSNAFAYQFQHTQSTSSGSDYLALQVYNRVGGSVTASAWAVNGNGNMIVGSTGEIQGGERLAVISSTNTAILAQFTGGASSGWAAKFWNNANSGDNLITEFLTNTSITARGSIRYDRAGNRLNIVGEGAGLLFTGASTFSSTGTFIGLLYVDKGVAADQPNVRLRTSTDAYQTQWGVGQLPNSLNFGLSYFNGSSWASPYFTVLTSGEATFSSSLTSTGLIVNGTEIFMAPANYASGGFSRLLGRNASTGRIEGMSAADIQAFIGIGNYVPYTGANQNVNLGANSLQVNQKIGTIDNQGIFLRGIADATHKIYYNSTIPANIWEYNAPILFQQFNVGSPFTAFTFSNAGNFTAIGSVNGNGGKPQLTANGGATAGAEIYLQTGLTSNPTLRRNWSLVTEDAIEGDFAIKCSTTAGGTPNTTRLSILRDGMMGINMTTPIYQLDVTTANYRSFRIQSSDDALITMGSTIAASQFYSIGVSSSVSGQGANLFWIGTSTNNPSGTLTKNFIINPSGTARFSSSVSLGTSLSGWGSGPALQVGNAALSSRTALVSLMQLSANQYWDGSNHRRISDGPATIYTQNNGVHNWDSVGTGVANATISWTQSMTLYSSGNLSIGDVSDRSRLLVVGTGGSPGDTVQIYNSSSNSAFKNTINVGDDRIGTWGLIIGKSGINTTDTGYHAPNGAHIVNVQNGPLRFGTNNIERLCITASGNVGVGTVIPEVSFVVKGTSIGVGGKASFYGGGDENNWSAVNNEAIRIGRADILNAYYSSIWSASGSSADENTHWLRFYISNSNGSAQTLAMTMNGFGNVGINKTTPQDKLDVAGEVLFGAQVERLSAGSASLAWNRRVATGQIYDTGRFAYQFQHTGSTTAANDYLALQVYNNSGGGVNSTAFVVNGNANTLLGTGLDNSHRLRVEGSVYASGYMYTASEGTGFVLDANPNPALARTGVMKYPGWEGMLISGVGTVIRLAHRTDSEYVLGGTPSIRVDLLIATNGAATFSSSVTATSFFESSDSRIKTQLEDVLDYAAIANVKAKYYEKNGKIEIGYFAQDFESILPNAISENEEGYLNLSYREVHTAKIAYLEKRINELEQQLKNK